MNKKISPNILRVSSIVFLQAIKPAMIEYTENIYSLGKRHEKKEFSDKVKKKQLELIRLKKRLSRIKHYAINRKDKELLKIARGDDEKN